jgi:peptidoglycan-associated lipoprotein
MVAPEPAVVEEEVVVVEEEVVEIEEISLQDAFFDFDKSVIRQDAREALDENIGALDANSEARVVIEGHADERGTNEYNLALGERRANAVRDYLMAGGVDPERIFVAVE